MKNYSSCLIIYVACAEIAPHMQPLPPPPASHRKRQAGTVHLTGI
jgi:hypothetical protein